MSHQHILVVEDDHTLRAALSDTLHLAGYKTCVAESAEKAITICGRHNFHAMVSDINLPGMDGHALMSRVHTEQPDLPVILMTGYADTQKAVDAMKAGARDYLVKPFPPARLLRQLKNIAPTHNGTDWIAEAPSSRHIKNMARRVAASDATVMITGESGTGKEVLSRFIHSCSNRNGKSFVAVNCAALPDTMLESILFGHEKGAFTGASQKHAGKFEQADGGTLFLDEVAEMPLPQQAKLLRVLQEREVERLGGNSSVPVDVRVITATNRNLEEEVKCGRFRQDLFYRLNVFPLHIPPLRERKEDIRPLSLHLLKRHTKDNPNSPDSFAESALADLTAYNWPGNIRELDNTIQRSCVVCIQKQIQASDLLLMGSPESFKSPTTDDHCALLEESKLNSRQKAEFGVIIDTLQKHNGHRGETAEELGITTRMLRYKLVRLRELGITL